MPNSNNPYHIVLYSIKETKRLHDYFTEWEIWELWQGPT